MPELRRQVFSACLMGIRYRQADSAISVSQFAGSFPEEIARLCHPAQTAADFLRLPIPENYALAAQRTLELANTVRFFTLPGIAWNKANLLECIRSRLRIRYWPHC